MILKSFRITTNLQTVKTVGQLQLEKKGANTVIDKPIIIKPEDIWTENEIDDEIPNQLNNPNWIPECYWLVRDEKGSIIPHPERKN